MEVLSAHGITFEEGMDIEEIVSKDMRQKIYAVLCEGFRTGEIEFKNTLSNKEKLANASKLNQYVSGLVSNWFRKDVHLNGGEKYVAQNPGSRAGSSDPQLKALRVLATKFKDNTAKSAEITKHIDTRIAQLRAERAKSGVKVDISTLPADLVASLGLDTEE